MNKLLPVGAAAIALALAFGANTASAAELPTPSNNLPYDIYTNLGGIDSQLRYDFDHQEQYSPDDADYPTPELRKHVASYSFDITNTYWKSLKIVGVDATATPAANAPDLVALTESGDEPAPQSAQQLGLTRVAADASSLSPILTGDTNKTVEKNGKLSVTLAVPFDQANITYTKNGKLAAFGFEGNAAIYLQGVSSDDRTFVFKDAITFDESSPVFSDIRSGSFFDCPTGQLCSSGASYTISGNTAKVDFPPLEPPVDTVPSETPSVPAVPDSPEPAPTPSAPVSTSGTTNPAPTAPATPESAQKPSEPASSASATPTPQLAYTGVDENTVPLLVGSTVAVLLGVVLLAVAAIKRRKEKKFAN